MKFKNLLPLFVALLAISAISMAFLPDSARENTSQLNVLSQAIEDSTNTQSVPAILVKDAAGVSKPIRMRNLEISVEVIGNIATTTMSMTFHNDSNRVLEGQLYFPLGEGQTVSRFAMDVEGQLWEGVVVEKNKGQQVFESVVRRNIDPGLLEWTKGNNFKARVYPLEPDGDKHIVVAYQQELAVSGQAYEYQLPMHFEEEFDRFSFKLKAHQQQLAPRNQDNSKVNLQFSRNNGYYATKLDQTNYKANRSISIEFPIPEKKQQIYTEKIPGSDQYYYYISFPEKQITSEAFKPKSIALVWDASTSSSNRNFEKEWEVLQQYLNWNKDVELHVYVLRNTLYEKKSVSLNAQNFEELKKTLMNIKLDGASAYEQIDYSTLKGESILLFGDGLSNFGEDKLVLPEVPIFTINSSASANFSYLKYLAISTGGSFVNLLDSKPTQWMKMLQNNGYKYYGNEQSESYPSTPTQVNDFIHIAGIIDGKKTISFEFGTESNRQVTKVTIDPSEHLTNSGLLGRIWAQKKLAELDINFKENNDEITKLGKQFNIVTRNTSLIVLDRVEDYVEHEIVPPTELQKEYYALLEKSKKDEQASQKEHMNRVAKDFEAYVNWWHKDIDLEQILEKDRQKEKLRVRERNDNRTENMADSTMTIELRDESDGNSQRMEEVEISDGVFYSYANAVPAASGDVDHDFEVSNSNFGRLGTKASINVETWKPDAAYMKPLNEASKEKLYGVYLNLKKTYSDQPSFYLDAADVFLEKGLDDLALRVLSNIAEYELENHELMRVLAHRLEQLEYFDLAIAMYQEVLKIRKEEPQSYRDLGLCLAKNEEYQKAITILYKMVQQPWDSRFPGIENIGLIEMNKIIYLHKDKVTTDHIDPKLLANLPVDVRVVLNWDADNCDMDLWVTDPRGEKCFYSHKKTDIGGLMSNDFTGGYGPEQFVLKSAMKGNYKVQVNFYGTRSQRISGPTTIQVQMITNYGKPNEKTQEVTRRLGEAKEVLDIGTFSFL